MMAARPSAGPPQGLPTAGAAALVLLLTLSFLPLLTPWLCTCHASPLPPDPGRSLLPPGTPHWLGTDVQGRDVFCVALVATRQFLGIASVSLMAAVLPGIALGLALARAPRWVERPASAALDGLLSVPHLLRVLAAVVVLGMDLNGAVLAMAIGALPGCVIRTRDEVLAHRACVRVEALRALGASEWELVCRTLGPRLAASLAVYACTVAPVALLAAALLSFPGPGSTWPPAGTLLALWRPAMHGAWWTVAAPVIVVGLTLLATQLLARAMQDPATTRERSSA